jgi:hypothetical protein
VIDGCGADILGGVTWQAIRATGQRLWEDWVVEISVAQVLVAGLLVYAFDRFFIVLNTDQFWSGPVDWTAHIGTALLILNLFPLSWRRAILPTALLGSFLIDLDHIPQFFGAYFLTEGTPRPYTHSLTTPVVLTLVGLALIYGFGRRRAGILVIGFAVGTLLHFFRDLAELPGSGMALFWPLTKRAYQYAHWLYLVLIGGLILANLVRLAVDPALREATWLPPARPAGGYPRERAYQRSHRP